MAEKIQDVMMEVEVERLTPHPKNPRRGKVKEIMRSLDRFGQVKPLIVQRSTGFIVAGNHTYKAAKELGWKTVKILVKDMNDEEAEAYLIVDNRTADLGTWDEGELYETLKELKLEDVGYTLDDLETLAAAVGEGVVAGDTGDAIREKPDFAAPNGEAAPIRTEPLRDIVLLMPVADARTFGQHIAALQKLWGTKTVVETVRRAVEQAAAAVPQAPAAPEVMAGPE